MICDGCKELINGDCLHYSKGGMELFDRRGYCPFADVGPNKKANIIPIKTRQGQQKSKIKR